MIKDNKENDLGAMIRDMLKERALSMRKLSLLTGIDTATISRVINGKQQAKPEHLQQFAYHLGVPTEQLFFAAGFDVSLPKGEKPSDILNSIDHIQNTLLASNIIEQHYSLEQVKKELTKYEQYALTDEGNQTIIKEFQSKIDQVKGAGPFIEQLKQMFQLYNNEDATEQERAIIGSALLYFILSTDIIPDFIFPIGYLDDAFAVQIVLEKLKERSENEP